MRAPGILLLLLLLVYCESQAEEPGQFPSRTQYPPLLLFLHIPNDSTVNVKKGKHFFSSSNLYSNTSAEKKTDEYSLKIDLEALRSSFGVLYGLTESISVGLEIPFIFFWRGAMDDAVTKVHSVIGQPPKNDSKADNNIYSYFFETAQFRIAERGENVFGVGDVSFLASKRITPENYPFQAKLLGAIKLPTGKKEYMHGSGNTDFGVGAYLHYKLGKTSIYSFSSLIFPGQPEDFSGISVTPFFTESFTVEYQLGFSLSVLGQIDFNSNPFPARIINLGHYALDLVTGIKKNMKGNRSFTLSLTEDIKNHTAPDFSINIGFTEKF
ncbi:MAG: DUF3187 family protein [Nitrospinota bacterium]